MVKVMEVDLWALDGDSCRVQGLAEISTWNRSGLETGRVVQARSRALTYAFDRAS